MADHDLFDQDDADDFDPFSGMDDDKPAKRGGNSGSGGGGKSPDGKRSLAEFNAEVDRRIAVLRSLKQKPKARVEAANWLGESGDTRAIKALVQVYTSSKSPRGVRAAAKTALSKFKALDIAIDRAEGEEVEVALGRDENEWVVELLTEIAYNERKPRRRGRGMLLLSGVLAILLAVLIVIYQAAPADSVSISEVVKNLGIGATAVPTEAPTQPVDEFGNPLPTFTPTMTFTPTETHTPTLEPTATPVTLENVRSQLRDMYAVLSQIETQRGVLDQLEINWRSLQTDPGQAANLCRAVPPTVPADVELAPGFAEREPSLGFARDAINGALARLRTAWTTWQEGCAAGNSTSRITEGLQDILIIRDAFNTADTFLDLIPQQ